MENNGHIEEEPVQIAIDGTLDLHGFRPRDIGSLIPEYIRECHNLGIYHIRIIHGKGSGSLRKGVHALLSRLEIVKSFTLGDESGGSWGATIVELHK